MTGQNETNAPKNRPNIFGRVKSAVSLAGALAKVAVTGRLVNDKTITALFSVAHRRVDERTEQLDDVREKTRNWIRAAKWVELDSELTWLDQNRAATPNGTRLAPAMLDAAWDELCAGLPVQHGPCGDELIEPIPFERLERFMDAAKAFEDHYAINTLVADMCLRFGWSIRGGGYAQSVSDSAFESMQKCFDAAATFMDWFDSLEVSSPLHARVNYDRTAGVNTTLNSLIEAYGVWCELDPGDAEARYRHSFYLLPRWYGDYRILETSARQAVVCASLSTGANGAAGYAEFYLDILSRDAGALMSVDLELFEEGLCEKIEKSRDPQATVNAIASTLSWVNSGNENYSDGEHIRATRRVPKVRAIQDNLTCKYLEIAVPDMWSVSNKEMTYQIACSYLDQLYEGERVDIAPKATMSH